MKVGAYVLIIILGLLWFDMRSITTKNYPDVDVRPLNDFHWSCNSNKHRNTHILHLLRDNMICVVIPPFNVYVGFSNQTHRTLVMHSDVV